MNTLILTFTRDRETKNTIRYQETGDPPAVGTLYLQKHALKRLGDAYPTDIKLTVEVTDG